MQRHQVEHEIHCPPDRLWELFFSNEFNIEMYEQGMGFPSCKIPVFEDDGEAIHRVMVMVPNVELPKPLAKVVGGKVGFEEIGDWTRGTDEYRWKIVLAAFGDKVRIEGTMRVVPHGSGHSMRKVAYEVDAKVFGIGGLIEKSASQNVLNGWNNSAKWINEYVARHPA